jgi:type IV pilus assembly protein PilA
MRCNQNGKGYTLIELLVVITIIGILAAIAIPIYRKHTVKSRLVEVTNTMSHIASAVSTYYQDIESFPSSLDIPAIHTTLGVGLAGVSRISAANVTNGLITVTITNVSSDVDGSNLTLTPTTTSDKSVSWRWGGSVKKAYLPEE